MKHTIARILIAGSAAGSILFAGTASAIDWNITGFVRQEIAYSISSTRNYNNHMGNPYNNRVTPHMTHANFGDGSNALAATSLYVDPDGNDFGGIGGMFSAAAAATASTSADGYTVGLGAGANTSQAVDCHFAYQRSLANPGVATGFGPKVLTDGSATFAASGAGGGGAWAGQNCPLTSPGVIPDSLVPNSQGKSDQINFNTFNSRLELDIQAKFSRELSGYMKLRAYFDATRNFTDGDIGNHYSNPIWGSRGTLTEFNSADTIFDIPAFYFDWNRGPLWIRVGNQTIAWGEAYFFRTMDVANGLDLRRHLVLGPGAEEYQDQRIASPGIRVSYTFNNGWELDAFAQLFSPTVLPGANTPYNLVPMSGGRLNDDDGFDDAEGSINYGARITMPLTEAFTGILAYVNRRNPDGAFTSVDAPTRWTGVANGGCLNQHNDTLNVLANVTGAAFFGGADAGFGSGSVAGVQSALSNVGIMQMPTLNTAGRNMENGCGSAFAPDPTGTPSLGYWRAIQNGRLDNGHYLRQVINEFPAAKWAVRDIFGFGDERNVADTFRTLEGFRSSFGPFIQWFGRQFKRENIFMVGGNYIVTTDDPESIFDQLIIRGEVAVTPNKRITNNLSYQFTEVDDVVSSLIFEKYHRISDSFPATYMVFQWMHRTSTDMFGRDLDNNDTPDLDTFIDPVTGSFTAAAFSEDAMAPRGTDNANYVVFAFQQPFPNLIWRFDFAVLVDVAGGYLVQPGLRYRPAADWQWDLYANIIESPGGDNDTITETLDFADEVFVRLTYYF